MKWLKSPFFAGIAALLLGFALGIVLSKQGSWGLAVVQWFDVLGQLWVNALRMCLVPLVVSLLVTSVAAMEDVRALGRLGGRTVGLFLCLLCGSALLAVLVGPRVFSGLSGGAELLRAYAQPVPSGPVVLPSLRGFLLGLVPAAPLKSLVDGAMLPLIFFTVCFALAVTRLSKDYQAPVLSFFKGVREAMLLVMRGVLKVTPLGVLGLSTALGATSGLKLAGAVGTYLFWVCALQFTMLLLLYPIVGLAGRSIKAFAKAVFPAQAVAAGTRSSLASLPALIEGYRNVYGEKGGPTDFVLPLAVSTFKLNTPISDLIGPFFLAALMGAHLGFGQLVAMALVALAMSFSNPGIPSGGLFVVTAPVMMVAGLPLEGIGLLVAVDAIPDLFSTVLNVTGDQAVAVLSEKVEPLLDQCDSPKPNP